MSGVLATADRDAKLLADFDAGRKAALARAVSIVENHRQGFERLLATLHPRVGRAKRIGITGPPGAGKSTLTSQLVRAYREQGRTVAVVAVDPTSPFTGGALLGDRIRMESVALDPGVFIRSMATRGSLGGLAAATREVCDVLDAFSIDMILIETVGVGQSELDVARTADSSVVVLVPESGDSIQTLKAGLMEIADVFVVNKSDRPGADKLRREIEIMLGLRADGAWKPPVTRTIADQGEGVADVVAAIDRHLTHLEQTGEMRVRRRARLRERVVDFAEARVRDRLWSDPDTNAWLDAQLSALESGATNPFAVADALLARAAVQTI